MVTIGNKNTWELCNQIIELGTLSPLHNSIIQRVLGLSGLVSGAKFVADSCSSLCEQVVISQKNLENSKERRNCLCQSPICFYLLCKPVHFCRASVILGIHKNQRSKHSCMYLDFVSHSNLSCLKLINLACNGCAQDCLF